MNKRTKTITTPAPKYIAVILFRDGRSAWTNLPGHEVTENILVEKCQEYGWERKEIYRWRVEQDF